MWAENYDLDNIYTPVDATRLEALLKEAGYDKNKRNYVVNGFKNGFSLEYQGPQRVQRKSANLKLRVGSKVILWNKIIKEVQAKRVAGPYDVIPFENFIQSPVGLVPKDRGLKTRLIFHLSYPRNGESVNSGIPEGKCSVKYPDFGEAIQLCIKAGKGCRIGKSDFSAAFCHAPLSRDCWKFLIMKAENPKTEKTHFFVDKCLPFGSSISCAIFQAISNAIAFIVEKCSGKNNVNYLDDFLFVAWLLSQCNVQIQDFLDICADIRYPVSMEKTFWGSTILIFLGMLIDTENQIVCIPMEKIEKTMTMLDYFLNKANKKVTVLQVQKLAGLLNFLCRCIVPGRAFMARFYAMITSGTGIKLQQHHHVKIKEDNRLDLLVWKYFLSNQEVFCRPFFDFKIWSAEQICMYSDASGKIGFGAFNNRSWSWGQWEPDFLKREPSIEYLELFAVTVAVMNWLHRYQNRRIMLFCDNISVVHMLNKASSKCRNCMILIRWITLVSMRCNTRVLAQYIDTKSNGIADSLSRMEFDRFRRLAPHMEQKSTPIPEEIWPVSKIWLN